jgi:hypothetical protein
VPGATPVVQLDEPSLPAVLGGRVPTPSGYGTVRAVDRVVVEQSLGELLAVAPLGGRIVHCCADDAPIALLRSAGADAISLDVTQLDRSRYDEVGAAVDAGLSFWLGVLPGTDAAISRDTARAPIERLWRELGFAPGLLAGAVVPTPACGLAGASPGYVRRVTSVLRDTGKWLLDAGG